MIRISSKNTMYDEAGKVGHPLSLCVCDVCIQNSLQQTERSPKKCAYVQFKHHKTLNPSQQVWGGSEFELKR